MRLVANYIYAFLFILQISCGNSKAKKIEEVTANEKALATSTSENLQAGGIVGEWEQQYTCFDKNGNYKLDPEEKTVSGTKLGFDWFRFNSDRSCLRDKDVKLKATYYIQEKNGTMKLVIQGGDNLRYTIAGLTDKELVLGSDGAFIFFKRNK